MSRPLFAQINVAALSANLARARELAPGTQLLAVVKADAYGHGLMRVLPSLEQADGLALLELDAAVVLRERHYTRRILLLEGFFDERAPTTTTGSRTRSMRSNRRAGDCRIRARSPIPRASSASAKWAATSCGPASCSTARRRSRTSRRARWDCSR